jgi:diacylglycerol O-acyltransferase
MTIKRERISGVDTAWLRMEHPTNLMMIVGVMMYEARLDLEAVKRIIATRFLAYRRFRQKAVQDSTGAWWEDDADFDLDSHVHRAALPGRADKAELEAFVSDLASTPLDFSKPLWQFHLVDNYRGGSALVMRIHHCYADGIALVQVMLSLTNTDAAASLETQVAEIDTPDTADADFWGQILKPVAGALENAGRIGKDLAGQARAFAANPQAASDTLQGALGKGVGFAGEIAKLVTMGADSPTRFKGPLGVRKRVAWADPLPLEEVKVMGKALGCSINDVLLSMAAGALRDYLVEHGDPVDDINIRAIVPVNLRPGGDAHQLGNRFGLVFLDLPVFMDHPLERLYELRRRMRELKGSYQPLLALGLLNAVGYGPRVIQEQVTNLLGQNASAVMTNVPGPPAPLYFAGKRITEQNFWVPQSGSIGMGVSILSYDGRIQFGVITDVGLVPDPNEIVGRFGDEYEKLMWLTLMSPWGENQEEKAPATEGAEAFSSGKPKTRAKAKGAGAKLSNNSPSEGAASATGPIPKRFRNL